VLLVLPIENNNHLPVHVQMDIMKMMYRLLPVLSVLSIVLPVTQIQMSVEDVVLVLVIEKIIHQPVLVKMDTLKMLLVSVNLVTVKDV